MPNLLVQKMNKLKHILKPFLLIVLIIMSVQCTSINDNTSNNHQSDNRTTISFAINERERNLYEKYVETFEEIHPNIKVTLVSTKDIMGNLEGTSNKAILISADQALPKLVQSADVISWDLQLGGYIDDGLLLDLKPLMEGDDNFGATDFYPSTLEQNQWNNGIWGIPTTVNYILIFYNKDLFDKAGVDYPKVGWSWDDFLAAAQDVTLHNGNEVTQWGFFSQFLDPMQLVQAKVGPIFNLDIEPPTSRLGDPEVISAFQWVIDLHSKYQVSPYVTPPESEEEYIAYEKLYNLVEDGKVAMWPEIDENYSLQSERHNIGVVPFPTTNENDLSSPIYRINALGISAGTIHRQAAWEWIKFLTYQNNDYRFGFFDPVSSVNGLPVRRSVAESQGVWDKMDNELATALRFASDHGFVSFQPPFNVIQELHQIIPSVIDEKKNTDSIMASVQQTFESYTKELISVEATMTPIPDFTVSEPPGSQIENGSTIVRFMVSGGDISIFRILANDFHELHPDIIVKVEEPNYHNEEFSLQSMINDADAFQWWDSVRSGDDLEMILSLQPFLDADPELDEEDFYPAILNQLRDQGQIIGLPSEVQFTLLNYNKRLFDAADIEYPQVGWTLDDFLETTVALTQGENEENKIFGYVPDLNEIGDMMAFIIRQDVSFIDENIEPPTIRLNDPDTISALRWYTNLTTEYSIKPDIDFLLNSANGSNPYEIRQSIIENNRAAIWMADQFGVVYHDEFGVPFSFNEEFDTNQIGAVPYPVGKSSMLGFESINGFYISAQTEVPQEAWEWIKFLTYQESLAQFGLPARIIVAESNEFSQRIGEEKASVMIATLESSNQAFTMSNLVSGGHDWLVPAIGLGLQGAYDSIIRGATVEEALQSAQNKAEIYRQCIIENNLVGSIKFDALEACLKKADPSWGF